MSAVIGLLVMRTRADRENRHVARAEPESIIYHISRSILPRNRIPPGGRVLNRLALRTLILMPINRTVIGHCHWSSQQPIAAELTSQTDAKNNNKVSLCPSGTETTESLHAMQLTSLFCRSEEHFSLAVDGRYTLAETRPQSRSIIGNATVISLRRN